MNSRLSLSVLLPFYLAQLLNVLRLHCTEVSSASGAMSLIVIIVIIIVVSVALAAANDMAACAETIAGSPHRSARSQ